MSPPQALVAHLEAEKVAGRVFFEYRRDEGGHIAMLFVADIRSVSYLNQHPDILLLDCTYKTNKFDMPLLNILGVDNMGYSFSVGFCFLDQEVEENYDEAIRHLRSLFNHGIWPSVIATDCEAALITAIDRHFPAIRTKRVLCYWHISKCILTNCKANFNTAERWEEFIQGFRDVVYAKTEDEYTDILNEFKDDFYWNSGQPYVLPSDANSTQLQEVTDQELERQALVYVLGQWLVPHCQHIVHAWTDRFFHCGTTTTSRLEGAHAVLKRWIGSPSKDLTRVWDSIKLALDDQFNEISVKKAQQAQGTPSGLSSTFYHQVLSQISHHGLYMLQKQYMHYRREEQHLKEGQISTNCTSTFSSSMGMPCWHMIKERIQHGQGIILP
jgi:hypothetical protein